MKSKITFAALVLALAAAPIFAQDTGNTAANPAAQAPATQAEGQAQAAPATTEPDPGEEVICRRDRATGSLTRVTRVCKTRNEWNNTHANTRDNMNDMQRNASGGSSCRQDQMGGC